MTKIKPVRKVNVPLVLMMFLLVMFGLVILYSVSSPDGYATENDAAFFLKRQIAFTVIGLLAALVIQFIPVNFFKSNPIWIGAYGASLGLAILTRLIGADHNGARRWIEIGTFQFQPSELCKVALIIALAGYREFIVKKRREGKLKTSTKQKEIWNHAFFDFMVPVSAAVLVDLFILMEPHLSCFIIIGFVIFMCTVNSGASVKSWIRGVPILLAVGILAASIYIAANPDFRRNFAHVYQRLNIFAATSGNEEVEVSEDEARQVTNAHNALGSGGMWGRGIGSSRAKYNYVSEAQNDYIFSIYVEETGFVGGVILILAYCVTFVLFVQVVMRANTIFSRMLATGCSSLIMIQVILNLAVELQVAPSTGVTLPFVSYGGTAQVFLLVAYGLILCVSRSGTSVPQKKLEKIEE
ncbi:MAG: FtsW/RodA/SpoVE family cell cycle protein [Saccharofermentans sp.]|nr:FtsW/RodA/SpoVE family cell cycle protein [Saccharofermentans sp.]